MLSRPHWLFFIALALTGTCALQPAHRRAVTAPALVRRQKHTSWESSSELQASARTSGAPRPSGASSTSTIINLAKSIVGSGVLALAAGIAALSASKLALVPALTAMAILAAISCYTFSIIARVGDAVGEDTYRATWAKIFGERTAAIPDCVVCFECFFGAVAFSIIIGDTFAALGSLAGLPPLLCRPNTWILLLSGAVLLPLCLLRDLSSLAYGSVIGNAGTLCAAALAPRPRPERPYPCTRILYAFTHRGAAPGRYTAIFMTVRALDGSYRPGGKFHALVPPAMRPSFTALDAAGGPRSLLNPSLFVLVSMLSTAFLAHFNANKLYNELAPPADGSPKIGRFNAASAVAFAIAALLSGGIAAAGFLTFGASSQGLILNNYATGDRMASLARLGIGLSIVFSYPLNFLALRSGVHGMLKLDGASGPVHLVSTLLLFGAATALSMLIKDLGLLIALPGALLGSALVYIFPALMAIGNAKQAAAAAAAGGGPKPAGGARPRQAAAAAAKPAAVRSRAELVVNYGLVGLGVVLAVVGGAVTLNDYYG